MPGPQPGGTHSKRLASRTLRQRGCVVLSHRVRGNLLRQPRGTETPTALEFHLQKARGIAGARADKEKRDPRSRTRAFCLRRGRSRLWSRSPGRAERATLGVRDNARQEASKGVARWRAGSPGPPGAAGTGLRRLTRPPHLTSGTEITPRAPLTPRPGSAPSPHGEAHPGVAAQLGPGARLRGRQRELGRLVSSKQPDRARRGDRTARTPNVSAASQNRVRTRVERGARV